jgi:PAS domain S-box-containing protein
MYKLKNLSIKNKMICIVLSVTIMTLIFSTTIIVFINLKGFKADMMRNLIVLATAVGGNSRASLIFDDIANAKRTLSSLKAESQIDSAALFNNQGEVFVTYTPDQASPYTPPTKIVPGEFIYKNHLEIIEPIYLENELIGLIYLKAHMREFESRVKKYLFFMGLIFIVTLITAYCLALFLQKFISDPLIYLTNTARKISRSTDYSVRVNYESSDELGILFSSFNEMLSEIEKREFELDEYRKHLEEKIIEIQLSGQKLKKSEETTRTILANAFDAIIVIDSNGIIKNWNRSAEKIFGWNSKEVVGTSLAEKIIPQEYREAHEKGMARFLSTGYGRVLNQQLEMTALHRSGEQFPVEFSISATKVDQSYIFTGIIRDITERKQAEKKLLNTQEQLRSLSNKLQSVREEEKASIAREIHDELGQVLTSLKIDLSWVRDHLQDNNNPLIEKIEGMNNLIEQTVQMIQRIATKLRPRILDILGICDALEWQAKEFQKRTGIECVLTIRPENIDLDPERSIALFRIYQEALTNVARHADANYVQSYFLKQNGKIILEICDNGKGMPQEKLEGSKSFGLFGIQERILVWNGEAKFLSKEGGGTTISVSIPLDQA